MRKRETACTETGGGMDDRQKDKRDGMARRWRRMGDARMGRA
ncbi:MAG: hypothetical protein PUI99_07525 [Clostridiales bacterium]|nr:hypothetical protein [Clostridiales bacterium]